jgi:hypothetical protein
MPFKDYRQQSRDCQWGTESVYGLTAEQINCGSLLRIADSLERMEKPFVELLRENKRLREIFEEDQKTLARLYRQRSALRGVITRLKKNG